MMQPNTAPCKPSGVAGALAIFLVAAVLTASRLLTLRSNAKVQAQIDKTPRLVSEASIIMDDVPPIVVPNSITSHIAEQRPAETVPELADAGLVGRLSVSEDRLGHGSLGTIVFRGSLEGRPVAVSGADHFSFPWQLCNRSALIPSIYYIYIRNFSCAR